MYNPTSDLKTCGHITFKMLGSNFEPDCRGLIYIYLDVNKIEVSCRVKTVL